MASGSVLVMQDNFMYEAFGLCHLNMDISGVLQVKYTGCYYNIIYINMCIGSLFIWNVPSVAGKVE